MLVAALLAGLMAASALDVAADLVAVGWDDAAARGADLAVGAGGRVAIAAPVMFGSFAGIALVFKLLCATLLVYFVVAVMLHPPRMRVLGGPVVPQLHLDASYLTLLVAVLGDDDQPLSVLLAVGRIGSKTCGTNRKKARRAVPLEDRRPRGHHRKLRASQLDVTGMAFSNLVMFAIMVSASATLHAHGQTNLNSAGDAAKALEPLAGGGPGCVAIVSFGFGRLAIPGLAGAGAAGMSGLLGERFGSRAPCAKRPQFYGLVAVGTLGGTLLSLTPVDPGPTLVISYLNGVAAAFLLSSAHFQQPHHHG